MANWEDFAEDCCDICCHPRETEGQEGGWMPFILLSSSALTCLLSGWVRLAGWDRASCNTGPGPAQISFSWRNLWAEEDTWYDAAEKFQRGLGTTTLNRFILLNPAQGTEEGCCLTSSKSRNGSRRRQRSLAAQNHRSAAGLQVGKAIAWVCFNILEEVSLGAVGMEIYSVLKCFTWAAAHQQNQNLSRLHHHFQWCKVQFLLNLAEHQQTLLSWIPVCLEKCALLWVSVRAAANMLLCNQAQVSSLSLPAAFLNKAPSPQPTPLPHRQRGMRSGLCKRLQKNKGKINPGIVNRWQTCPWLKITALGLLSGCPGGNWQTSRGSWDFIEGCVLRIIKNFRIFLRG